MLGGRIKVRSRTTPHRRMLTSGPLRQISDGPFRSSCRCCDPLELKQIQISGSLERTVRRASSPLLGS
jgi:hypothetical protein